MGGGSNPKPGEISLAQNGTLFLDGLPEFDRKVLEVLREPLETGHITISRAAGQVMRYRARVSGPLLDRIDMHLEVPRISHEVLRKGSPQGEESSASIRARVVAAHNRALVRSGKSNSALTGKEAKQHCHLTEQGYQILKQAMNKPDLSHRAYHRILKLARTIADLAESGNIEVNHLSEAIGYRKLGKRS